ncbi:unnamed protein product [Schistocephalus solidus]|uniref:Uncharacterized protein n=1 Tax=Schistocephalus solidus TaxID=70667 RepID=A0A3P7BUE8_SCHSO|nr:unnamed protein product [Schistocephalus solidus]
MHLTWPPPACNASALVDGISAVVEVAWPSEPGGPVSGTRVLHPVSQLSLLLMPSSAPGLPGELVIQAGLLLHNLLPHSLHFRVGWSVQRGGFSKEGVIQARSRLAIYLPTAVSPHPLTGSDQSAKMKFVISLSDSEGWTPFSLVIPTPHATSPEAAALFVKRQLIQLSLPGGLSDTSLPVLFTSRLCHLGEMLHPFLILSFSSPLTITNHLPLPLILTSSSAKETSFVTATAEDAALMPSFSSADQSSVKATCQVVPILATGVESFHFSINYDNGDPVFAAPLKLQVSDLLERLFQLDARLSNSGIEPSRYSNPPSRLASRTMLGLSPISPHPLHTGLAEEGFELVILPWLLLRNQSGLDLLIYTSAGAQKEGTRGQLHRLPAGTSCMPPSGQRLFRLGLSAAADGQEALSWSSSLLLVHKSAFAAAVSAATTGRATEPRTFLIASEPPQTTSTTTTTAAAAAAGPQDSAAPVTPLLPSRPCLVVTIPMGANRVCCLSVELRIVNLSTPGKYPSGYPQPPPQVLIVISPHVRFVNRSGCPLLLKLLALPLEPKQPPVSLDKFKDHSLSLPGSSPSAASTVDGHFWNSCSLSEQLLGSSGPLDLRYFMAVRAPSSKWWSQCLQVSLPGTATVTPHGDGNTAAVSLGCTHPGPHSQSCVPTHYHHFSFMLSDQPGNRSDEFSILVSIYREERSACTVLMFDRLPDPMRQCLACCLCNLTAEPFQVALEPAPETSPLLSGHLPTLPPNGGKLVLLPQSELDCFCQPSVSAPPQDAGHVHGSCSFLAQGNIHLRFQSTCNVQTFHLDLAELLITGAVSVLRPATTTSPAIRAKVEKDTAFSTMPFRVSVIITYQDDRYHSEQATLVALSYPHPCASYFLHIDHLTVPIFSAVSFGNGDVGNVSGFPQRMDEFMRLSVKCLQAAITLDYRDDKCALMDFHLSSSFLQLDNRAHSWTNLFDFPVLLRSALTPASQTPSSTASLFSLRGRSIGLGVHWIEVEVPHLEVFLEDSAVAAVIRWAQDLHIALTNSPDWGKHAPTGPRSSPTLTYLRYLRVAPLSLQVALQAAMGVHLSCKSTRLSLAAFQILAGVGRSSGLVITPSCLLGQLGVHYISQAIFRAGWVLGGLELIGNPAGLVSAFADGVWDLVHFTDTTSPPTLQQAQRIDREERLSLLRGLASGLTSLTKHATGGVISSVTGLAATFARNMHALSLDSEHVQRVTQTRQRTGEPSSLFHGLRLGLSEFGISLLGGLAGIAHHPLQALMPSVEEASSSSSSSPFLPALATAPAYRAPASTEAATTVGAISRLAGALVTGLSRSLVGVVTKPLAGAADLVAMAGTGFMHGMGVSWGVNLAPRHLSEPYVS